MVRRALLAPAALLSEVASRVADGGALAVIGWERNDSPSWQAVAEVVEQVGGDLERGRGRVATWATPCTPPG